MRANVVRMLRAKEELFPGHHRLRSTVIPGLVNAILSKHDFILLGLRGQAKTRILRGLVRFLDEQVPVIAGTETNDDPFAPVSSKGRETVAPSGDATPIEWLPREARYREKLATPDVTIADLIGDIDPIKAATRKLTYADEEVIHFGIIPRTNRGIFAINELPDLPPRIQVGLLNIMEEKDIQIRGFPIRMQLDIVMVYSANPEDYTNRGNIITPLKDRIDSQIITHYPRTGRRPCASRRRRRGRARDCGIELVDAGLVPRARGGGGLRRPRQRVREPGLGRLRAHEHLPPGKRDEQHGTARHHAAEKRVYPRIGDLHAAVTAITGKVELVYEGEQQGAAIVARKIIGEAVKETFRRWFPDPDPEEEEEKESGGGAAARAGRSRHRSSPSSAWFSKGNTVETSDELPYEDYVRRLEKVHGSEGGRGQAPGPEGRGRRWRWAWSSSWKGCTSTPWSPSGRRA